MDLLQFIDLRTFCHLQPEHSFHYGMEQAVLCQRCTGVYSGFLVAWVAALALRWKGRWRSAGLLFQVALSAMLIGLSALHVGLTEFLGLVCFDLAWLRFLIGCLAGLGLLQLQLLLSDGKNSAAAPPQLALASCFAALFALHYAAVISSWLYSTITSLAGIAGLYLAMNQLVVRSFFPKIRSLTAWAAVILATAAEWAFLYWYKTCLQ